MSSSDTAQRTYTIKEAAGLVGLPASTLRYYESIGVINPIGRGETSKHRICREQDLDTLVWVACLSATGMSVPDMRQYLANSSMGSSAAGGQIDLLKAQQARLALEADRIAVRRKYVQLKIGYWEAIGVGDGARAERLAQQARTLADELKTPRP